MVKLQKTLIIVYLICSPALIYSSVIQEKKPKPKWYSFEGDFQQVSVTRGSKQPIIVALQDNGTIQQLNPDWKSFTNIAKPGAKEVKQISVGGDGAIGCIDSDDQAWLYIDKTWKPLGTLKLRHISVGNQNVIWGVDVQGNIVRKKAPTTANTTWQRNSKGVCVSSSGDGTVLLAGNDQNLYKLNRQRFKWEKHSRPGEVGAGGAKKIIVADQYCIGLINNLDGPSILLPGATGTREGEWQRLDLPSKVLDLAIGVDKTIAVITQDKQLRIRKPAKDEKEFLKQQRGLELYSNQMIGITSSQNTAYQRLWTHGASVYDPHANAVPPHNHVEVLVGSNDSRQDIGNFFSITYANDSRVVQELKFGSKVEVWSLASAHGHPSKSGPLNKEWKWWSHKHHFKWGKNFRDIVVSLIAHPQTQDGSNLFELVSPCGRTGKIQEGDAVEIVSKAKHSLNKRMWVHGWSRYGKKFNELLIMNTGATDTWGMRHSVYGSRDFSGRNLFTFKPINSVKDLPKVAASRHTKMTPKWIFQRLIGAFWKDATAQKKRKKKINLRATTGDGWGIVKQVINKTDHTLTMPGYHKLPPGNSNIKMYRYLNYPLTLKGHANDHPVENVTAEKILSIDPMWSQGVAWHSQSLKSPGKFMMTFIGRGGDEGNIQIILGTRETISPDVRIVIGGWKNSKSAIVAEGKIWAESDKTYSPYSQVFPGMFIPYWISFDGNFMMVGSGIPGTNTFLSCPIRGFEDLDRIGFSCHAGEIMITELQFGNELTTHYPDYVYPAKQPNITLQPPAEYSTKLNYKLRVPNEGSVIFDAQAAEGVAIEFEDDKQQGYRVILGANINKEMHVERNGTIILNTNITQALDVRLNASKPKRYWVSINGGAILAGQGELGENIFLSWQDPAPLPNLEKVSFMSSNSVQKISNIQFSAPVNLGPSTASNPYEQKPSLEKVEAGNIHIIRPLHYQLIQDGQRVALKDMLAGNNFHVMKTPQQDARYFLQIKLNALGVPEIKQIGGPQESIHKMRLESRARSYEQNASMMRSISRGLFTAAQIVGHVTKNIVIFAIDVIGAGVGTALIAAGAGVWGGAASKAASAAKTRLAIKEGYRAHDSYVYEEQATRKAGSKEEVPKEVEYNLEKIAKLLTLANQIQAGELEVNPFYDEEEEEEQDLELMQYEQLLNVYQAIIIRINHPYIPKRASLKERVYEGLQYFLEKYADFPELYDESLEIFSRAFCNKHLFSSHADDLKMKDEVYWGMIDLGDFLLSELIKDPRRSLIITPMYGEYIWLPGLLPKDGDGWAKFEVRGSQDFFICFGRNDTPVRKTENAIYEFHLGAFNNTRHEIHLYNLGRPAVKLDVNKGGKQVMLHPRRFRTFWVDLHEGTTRLGIGKEIGKNVLLQWKDQFPWEEIKMLGISTWSEPVTIRNIQTSNQVSN